MSLLFSPAGTMIITLQFHLEREIAELSDVNVADTAKALVF